MIRPLGGYYRDENVIARKIENTGCYVKKLRIIFLPHLTVLLFLVS